MSTGSFIWYELMTTDPDSAAAFYGAVIGWKIAAPATSMPDGKDYRMIVRSDGGSAGGMLKLSEEMLKQGARPVWLGYLHVVDVDAAVKGIEASGGRTLMPRMDLPVGSIAMVADPMGTPFYVMRPIPPPGMPDAKSDVFDTRAEQRVRWNELESPNLALAKVFYTRHFNFQFNEAMPMGATGDYCFADHDGVRIGAIMQQRPGHGPLATWLFYFGVRSIASTKLAIEVNGGRVLNGPHQVPGGDWILVATDPAGAAFGVVGPKGD
jgi:uncharacterized protein